MVQFNKMMVMLPVLFMARKLDGEDPNTVNLVRIAYALMQVVCVGIVVYTYMCAQAVAKETKVIYVPPPVVPFADPNAKKKYTEIAFGAHALTTARSLLGSTLFGIALTCGLHYYKGMIMGLAIQAAMAPFNLVENALVKAIFLGNGLKVDGKIFDEKEASELSPDDEVVDQSGQPVVRVGRKIEEKPLEEVLLDTWDAGAKADVSAIMSVMTKKNCNFQTKDDRWTALMILAGLGAKGTASAMRQLIELGANPAIADKEGWNALHWAAFHNSPDGARELRREAKLLSVPDKDGLTPLETAKKEKNDDVAKIIEEALGESKKSK